MSKMNDDIDAGMQSGDERGELDSEESSHANEVSKELLLQSVNELDRLNKRYKRYAIKNVFKKNVALQRCTESEMFLAAYGDSFGRIYWLSWLTGSVLSVFEIAELLSIHLPTSLNEEANFDESLVSPLVSLPTGVRGMSREEALNDPLIMVRMRADNLQHRQGDLLPMLAEVIAAGKHEGIYQGIGSAVDIAKEKFRLRDVVEWLLESPENCEHVPKGLRDAYLGIEASSVAEVPKTPGTGANKKLAEKYQEAVNSIVLLILKKQAKEEDWHQVAEVRDWLDKNKGSSLIENSLRGHVNNRLKEEGIALKRKRLKSRSKI